MPRIRTVKPSFYKDEDLCDLKPLTRILFQGLWCLADKEGRLEDRPRYIKVEILPYDKVNIEKTLSELHMSGFIQRYRISEKSYIQVTKFKEHQRITGKEAESESKIPPPPPPEEPKEKQRGNNGETTETTGREGKGREGNCIAGAIPAKIAVKQESQNPAHRLVRAWKRILCLPKDDYPSWDKANFGRCAKSANLLLEIFAVKNGDSLEPVADCMVAVYEELKKKGLECTLETVVKRAHEWKNGNNNPKR